MRRRSRPAIALAAALITPILSGQGAGAEENDTVEQVVGDFESDEGWTYQSPQGAPGEFTRDDTDPRSGSYAGLINADFTDGGGFVRIRQNLDHDATGLRFWVKSTDLSRVTIRMYDSTMQAHQQQIPLDPGGEWQQVTVSDFTDGPNYLHFGGANDGAWHPPASRVDIHLPKQFLVDGRTSGELRVDDVTLDVRPPDLEIEQVTTGNVVVQPERPAVEIVSTGDEIAWSARDFAGTQIGSGTEPVDGRSMVELPAPDVGYYDLDVTALDDGTPIASAETSYAVLSPFDVSAVDESPFGFIGHFERPDWGDPAEMVSLAAKSGAKNIRSSVVWQNVEPERGVYDFSGYAPMAQAIEENGLSWLSPVQYTNDNYDDGATPYTDDGRDGFANYAAATKEHFGSTMTWNEVYNEFNLLNFGDRGDGPADGKPEYYVPLLEKTYNALKAQDPDNLVVAPSVAGVTRRPDALPWMEEVLQLGGIDYMDAIAIHTYVWPDGPEVAQQRMDEFADLVREHNDGELLPIWITEQGWPTHSSGSTEAEQAAMVPQAHAFALANDVEKYFWYSFMNNGNNTDNKEHNFGLLRSTTDPKGASTPKPGYVSYAVMTRQLTGAEFIAREDVGDGVSSYAFDRDGTDVRVLWADEPTTVALSTDEELEITELMGTSQEYQPHGGRVHVTVSDQPVYVTGAVDNVAVDATYSLTADDTTVAAGDDVGLTLTVDTSAPRALPVKGTFELAGQEVALDIGPREQEQITLTVPSEAVGARTFTGRVTTQAGRGRTSTRLTASVDVVQPVAASAAHVLRDGDHHLRATVTNQARRDLELENLHWSVGDARGTAQLDGAVPSGSETTVDVPLSDLDPGNYSYVLTVPVPGAQAATTDGTAVVPEAGSLHPMSQAPVTVDGEIDDLSGIYPADLTDDGTVRNIEDLDGPADLGGQTWATWDDDNLYLSASISDDVHHQPNTGNGIWAGDSIQIGVAAGLPGESAQWYEYGIALTPDGPQAWRYSTADDSVPTGVVSGADLAIMRNEDAGTTTYELALPWSQLTPASPADGLLSLSLLVNENDGDGREGWIEWGGGIGGGKNAALFNPMRLS